MKINAKKILLLCFLITGCNNNSTSSSSDINLSSENTSSSSKELTSSISSSNNNEEISIDFVVNKLNEVKAKSYTLNYSYLGISYNDIFVPNSYYYNDLYKTGNVLIDLFGNNKYLFDYSLDNNNVDIKNQSYNEFGSQGLKELSIINLSDFSCENFNLELTKVDNGIKLENQELVNYFTGVIKDSNTFDYIIFNKNNNDLVIDFYFEDTLYDGYSYTLKNIGQSNNDVLDSFISNNPKLSDNGVEALDTFKASNIVIDGDINFTSAANSYNFESLKNVKVKENGLTKYKLESISNGVSYKQFYTYDGRTFNKLGLDGANNVTLSSLDISENEIYPNSASFLNDCYLINDEYVYLGSNSNKVISSLLINASSIIIDAWIKEIRFKLNDNKIESFSFITYETAFNDDYGYFNGEFNLLDNGVIGDIDKVSPSKDDARIKELLNSISSETANYKLVSTSYVDESKKDLAAFEKHVINYVDGVYFDANYRINTDYSLTMQFGNGYSLRNGKVYSFRYDVSMNIIDNVKETGYSSIQEAILSLSSEVMYIQDGIIKIDPSVSDISENVRILEQSMLIDPSTINFYFDDNSINKITYKYGNSYTSCYVEAEIEHNEGFIDNNILNLLNDSYPNDNEVINELYLNDAQDETVLSIYNDLYENGYGEKANSIPYIPGVERAMEILWINDYPEGYQYLIADAPFNYLDKFKDALVNVYGYNKVNDNLFANSSKGITLEIKEDTGYQQFYFILD